MCRQKNEFSAMDPNFKLFLEEMSKQLRVEIASVKLEITDIKGGLTAYNSCLDEIGVADQ
jgi:hypothetical protein